jgi:hypothetical protein
MWRRVDLVWTDVSEERIASVFRVEKCASEEPTWAGGSSYLSKHVFSIFMVYFSTLSAAGKLRRTSVRAVSVLNMDIEP